MGSVAEQSNARESLASQEIHIIGTGIGAKGTLDSDSRAALELARHWADLGAAVTLYTNQAGYLLAQKYNLRRVVFCIWPAERWRRFGGPVYTAARGMLGLFHAGRIKTGGLIYSASNSWPDILAAQRARRLNREAKWLSAVKTVEPKYPLRFAANLAVTRQLERNSDIFFAATDADTTRLSYRLGRAAHTLGLGIDTDLAAQPAKRKKYDACFIAASESLSGWTQLAEAWRHARMCRPDLRLALMVSGSKSARPLIKRIFKRRGLVGNIDWLFDPDEGVKRQTLLASKVFISPFSDANSLFIAEAMAAGMPVVGFESAALRFDFPAGRLAVPAGDWASLGHAIIHILGHRGLYLRLKRQAKSVAADRDWRGCAGRALDFLRTAA